MTSLLILHIKYEILGMGRTVPSMGILLIPSINGGKQNLICVCFHQFFVLHYV